MKKANTYNQIDAIIAFEAGELEEESIIELFQNLVDTGLAWELQGSCGRAAKALIEQGLVKLPKTGRFYVSQR